MKTMDITIEKHLKCNRNENHMKYEKRAQVSNQQHTKNQNGKTSPRPNALTDKCIQIRASDCALPELAKESAVRNSHYCAEQPQSSGN